MKVGKYCLLFTLMLFSCQNYENSNLGYLKINLQSSIDRNIDSVNGSEHANCYELLIYNNVIGRMNFKLTSGNENIIEVPIGTYNILVLSGVDNTNYPNMMNKVALLGTAEEKNINVENHKETIVNLKLYPIEIDLIGQEQAVKDNFVNFKYTFDSKNENIFVKTASIGAFSYGVGDYSSSKVERVINNYIKTTNEPSVDEQVFYLYPDPLYCRLDFNRECDKNNGWKFDWITPYGLMAEFTDDFNNMFGNLRERVTLVEYQLTINIGW